ARRRRPLVARALDAAGGRSGSVACRQDRQSRAIQTSRL
ncbi:MAG: hypothetical protein AVDCRST_MAG67-2816, partial [uncultured Solirubrobacteraceae bacterium]